MSGGVLQRLRRPLPGGDGGNAMLEFVYLSILLMVPLIYVLTTVFQVQRAAFGVTGGGAPGRPRVRHRRDDRRRRRPGAGGR
jgi:hypothetical protein